MPFITNADGTEQLLLPSATQDQLAGMGANKGDLAYDETNRTIRIDDGVTPGGIALGTAQQLSDLGAAELNPLVERAEFAASKTRVDPDKQNTAVGDGTLTTITTGSELTAFGQSAAAVEDTGNQSTYYGAYAGQAAKGVSFATGIGRSALINNLGDYNTGVGFNAGNRLNSVSARFNTFVGALAGSGDNQPRDCVNVTAIGFGANATKSNQVVIGNEDVTETMLRGRVVIKGANALRLDDYANDNAYGLGAGPAGDATGSGGTVGNGNLGVGKNALAMKDKAIACTAIGNNALAANLHGIDHTAIGSGAMQKLTGVRPDGQFCVGNVAVGREALYEAISAGNVTALGDTSLQKNQADLNVGVGYAAARDNTTGSVVAVGTYAAGYTKAALRITVMGTEAFGGTNHGDDNTGVGYRVGSVMLGARNSIFGSEALLLAGTFTDVTALGYRAGFTTTGGSRNTFVGARSGKNDAGQKAQPNNTIALGADTFTTKDNQTVIGNTDSDEIVLHGVAFSRAQLVALKALLR
jgi:hypothetical protein